MDVYNREPFAYKPVFGVSGSVPHGGFLTLLATGEVIIRSSSGIVDVYSNKRVDCAAGSVQKPLTQLEKEVLFIYRVFQRLKDLIEHFMVCL